MATININYDKLGAGYLFPEIARRAKAFAEKHPGVELHRLGIGDTTQPLAPSVVRALQDAAERLSKAREYHRRSGSRIPGVRRHQRHGRAH